MAHAEFEQSYKPSLRPARMPTRRGFIYEPRAFWGVGRYDSSESDSPSQVVLPREFFYNGEPYPITLCYAIVSPINYTFDSYDGGGDDSSPATWRNCGAAAAISTEMVLSVRHRQQYMRIPGMTQSMVPRPSWEPEPFGVSGVEAAIRSPRYNYFSWDFDAAMVIPRLGNLEFGLSSYTTPDWLTITAQRVRAFIQFSEIGAGQMKGLSRIASSLPVFSQSDRQGVQLVFPPDGFTTLNGNNQTLSPFSPQSMFTAKEFQGQNQSSDGSVPIVGFGVMLDQQDYDTDIINAVIPGPPTAPPRIASLGSRIGTRARMRQGGSNRWWWREGAPLSLVCPTRTTGQVHPLRKPLTLSPGDNLEVELTFPLGGGETRNRVTQMGVSFLGYAAIEG